MGSGAQNAPARRRYEVYGLAGADLDRWGEVLGARLGVAFTPFPVKYFGRYLYAVGPGREWLELWPGHDEDGHPRERRGLEHDALLYVDDTRRSEEIAALMRSVGAVRSRSAEGLAGRDGPSLTSSIRIGGDIPMWDLTLTDGCAVRLLADSHGNGPDLTFNVLTSTEPLRMVELARVPARAARHVLTSDDESYPDEVVIAPRLRRWTLTLRVGGTCIVRAHAHEEIRSVHVFTLLTEGPPGALTVAELAGTAVTAVAVDDAR